MDKDELIVITLKEREELYEVWKNIYDHHIKRSEIIMFFHDFYILIGEVRNGGIHQYLTNSTGDCFNRLSDKLSKFGFDDIYDNFQKILKLVSLNSMPEDIDERYELIDRFGNERHELFDEIDKYFYQNRNSIEEKLYAFYTKYNEELNTVYMRS